VQIKVLNNVRDDYFKLIITDLLNDNVETNDVFKLGKLEVITSLDDNNTGYFYVLIKNTDENEFIKFTSEISYGKNNLK
jgi:hypothetical protein